MVGTLYWNVCEQKWREAATLLPTLTDEQVHEELSLNSEMDSLTALHQAIVWIPLDLLHSLVDRAGAVDKKSVQTKIDDSGNTPLHYLIMFGTERRWGSGTDLDAVKILVDADPQILQFNNRHGISSFELAEMRRDGQSYGDMAAPTESSAEIAALLKTCTEAVDAGDTATVHYLCEAEDTVVKKKKKKKKRKTTAQRRHAKKDKEAAAAAK
jgi:hypothetical protein